MQIVRAEAHAARSRMLGELDSLHELTPDAEAWIRKAGPEHYAEHLPHLRDWVHGLRVTQSTSQALKAIDLTTVPVCSRSSGSSRRFMIADANGGVL